MLQRELDESDFKLSDEIEAIKILLIGDSGVGKTSLIHSLVNDEFEPSLPAKMADIIVPAHLTPENVPLHISDYSERDQNDPDDLRQAILSSNVICIVYAANDDESLNRVASVWIPQVRSFQTKENGSYKPIILVANKVDLIEEGEDSLDRVSAIIQEYVDIEAYIEVSALSQKNVVELFSSAQKAVAYPLAPLFDPQMRVLTKKCRNALTSIFKLCDIDQDGFLNDHELNLFQENCFGTPLQKDALDDLKLIIKQSTIDGIVNNCMTETGFLFLHALSIDKGRHDFTWQVLRKFDYDNQINGKLGSLSSYDSGDSFVTRRKNDTLPIRLDDELAALRLGNSGSSEYSDSAASEGFVNGHLDLTWIREHSNLIKTGIGLTLATLLSLIALRMVVRNHH